MRSIANFSCLFCQNHHISRDPLEQERIRGHEATPEMLVAAALGVFLQVLVTENSRLVALFQTAALSGTEWRELLFLAAAPLAAHELLAGLSRISGARGMAGKEWTGS